MSVEQALLARIHRLSEEQKQQVLAYAESLPAQPPQPRVNPRGLWADLTVSISEEDIAEARREMWKNFPREV